MKKRMISLMLALCMMLTVLPVGALSAFAEEGSESSEGVMIPNKLGQVYDIREDGTTYQMSGEYDAPIDIYAKNVTINITGNVEYTGGIGSSSSGYRFLFRVWPGAKVTINCGEDYTVSGKGGGILVGVSGTDGLSDATICGGNFTTVGDATFFSHTMNLHLNNVHATSERDYVLHINNGDITVTDSTLESAQYAAVYNSWDGKVTLNRVTIPANNSYSIYNLRGETTINGGTYSRIYNRLKGILTINSGTITGADGKNAIINERNLYLNGGTVSSEGGTAILTRIDPSNHSFDAVTEINGGTIQNSAVGLRIEGDVEGSKTALKLGNAKLTGNDTDIELAADKQITIEDTFTGRATVKVDDDPISVPRPITTREAQNQDKLNLVSNNVDAKGKTYVVAYDADNNYRYLAQRTGYTVTAVNATAATADGPLSKLDQIAKDTEVTLTANTAPEGKEFSGWKFEKVTANGTEEISVLTEADPENPGTATFTMPDDDLIVTAEYQGIIIDPGTGDDDHGGDIVAGVVIGGIAGVGAYEVGTGLYRILAMDDVAMPANRIALAELMWERAGKPEPETMSDENLYSDLSAEDEDAQKAARWAVEQELMKEDDSVEGELKFHPAFPVSKLRVCLTWENARQKGLFDQNTEA